MGKFLRSGIVLSLAFFTVSVSSVEVSLAKGKVLGCQNIVTRNGRTVFSFTGIQYAEAPINELRFKDPIPKRPWSDVINATVDGPACPQQNVYTLHGKEEISGQEDCLNLNVYTPEVNCNGKLPVMVYIHGGSYSVGSNSKYLYGPEYLLDKNVVLVTINYRLSVLGFLSFGDEVLPGNLGMKDQVVALQWVKENIKHFGGNPEMITLFGESAGGSSAHLHMLSPLSKGLFHRAISMSGSALCPWAVIPQTVAKDRARAFATLVGCPTEPTTAVVECLRNVPVEIILRTQSKFYQWMFLPVVVFGPVVEPLGPNAFLTTEPDDAPESNIPWLTGISSGEGGVVASALFAKERRYVEEINSDSARILPIAFLFQGRFEDGQASFISDQVRQFYLGDKLIDNDTIPEFIQMMSDSWFSYGVMDAALKWNGNVFFYYFNHQNANSFNQLFGTGEIKSVSHSDILLNLFPLTSFFPFKKLTAADKQVSQKLIDLWTKFAQGIPLDTNYPHWRPIATSNKVNYLLLNNNEPKMLDNLLQQRYQFWQAIYNVADAREKKKTYEKEQLRYYNF